MLQPWTMRPDLLPRFYLFDFIFSKRTKIDKKSFKLHWSFLLFISKKTTNVIHDDSKLSDCQPCDFILFTVWFCTWLFSWSAWWVEHKHKCNGYYCYYNVAIVIVILIVVVMTRFQIMVSHGGVKKNNPDFRMHLLGFQISQMKPYLEIWRSLGLKCHH